MAKETSTGLTSTGFFINALVILFIALKLCHVIDWSWWWVFSPYLFSIGITLVSIGVYALIVFIQYKRGKV